MLAESEEPTSFSSSINVVCRGGGGRRSGGRGYRHSPGGRYGGGGHGGNGHAGDGPIQHQQGRSPKRDGHDAGQRSQNNGGHNHGRDYTGDTTTMIQKIMEEEISQNGAQIQSNEQILLPTTHAENATDSVQSADTDPSDGLVPSSECAPTQADSAPVVDAASPSHASTATSPPTSSRSVPASSMPDQNLPSLPSNGSINSTGSSTSATATSSPDGSATAGSFTPADDISGSSVHMDPTPPPAPEPRTRLQKGQ
ncbi:hypothetical protein GUJ93_ZPchr0008g14001 [Zizania palustris]|uniref:Uncharacterized protein n=1 Tax=Zizania palustris TaxID=103762 RepID=A0A8J5R6Z5_ZIZPA|nr:hypothetical protein GUJ93_ZPchr0008g14001 [Zizania palustris]